MDIHVIVDYSFLYYKYKNQVERGVVPHLTTEIKDFWGQGTDEVEMTDISEVYYSIKDIEGIRRNIEKKGDTVTLSVCFDSKTERKEESSDYKANRGNRLGSEDFAKMQLAKRILTEAGYNTYQVVGYESDDIVYTLVQNHKDEFEETRVYTPDMDLFVNIDDSGKIKIYRYKWTTGYKAVSCENFETYVSQELKCRVPFNAIMVYKATVGDKSDNIKGIPGFGAKAFDKMIASNPLGIDEYAELTDVFKAEKYLLKCLASEPQAKIDAAIECLSLVAPRYIDGEVTDVVRGSSTLERRNNTYNEYHMKSLVE